MSESETLDPATSRTTSYGEIMSIASLISSILFAGVTILTGILVLTARGHDGLVPLLLDLPLSLGGSVLCGLIPAAILRIFVDDRSVKWSLYISGAATILSGIMWLIIAASL